MAQSAGSNFPTDNVVGKCETCSQDKTKCMPRDITIRVKLSENRTDCELVTVLECDEYTQRKKE